VKDRVRGSGVRDQISEIVHILAVSCFPVIRIAILAIGRLAAKL